MGIARVIKFRPTAESKPVSRRGVKKNLGTLVPFPPSPLFLGADRKNESQRLAQVGHCKWLKLVAGISRLFKRRPSGATDGNNDSVRLGKAVNNR